METPELMSLLKGDDEKQRQLLNLLIQQVVEGVPLSDIEIGILEFLKKKFLPEA